MGSAPNEPAISDVRTVSGVIEKLYALAGSTHEPLQFGRMLLISDAERADTVLRNPLLFRKHYTASQLLGTSRFDADAAPWEARRRLTQPAYSEAARSLNRPAIRAAFDASLDGISAVRAQTVRDALLAASAVIFHRAFGIEVPGEDAVTLFEQARPMLRKMQHASLFGANNAEIAALAIEAKAVRGAFASWGGEAAPFRRFEALLPGDSAGIPDFDPLGEYLMNFLAGTETAVATMGWILDRLGASADLQDRMHREVTSATGQSALVETFINETLRYFPPIPYLVKRTAENTELGGFKLSAGRTLVLSLVGLHHDPQHWERPRRFDPARREFSENSYNRRAFLPFSMGARVCGGAGLARVELAEELASFVTRFRVTRAAGPTRFDFALAMGPESSALLTVEAR